MFECVFLWLGNGKFYPYLLGVLFGTIIIIIYYSGFCVSKVTLKNMAELIPYDVLTHCGFVMPYGNIGLVSGLLPDSTKP